MIGALILYLAAALLAVWGAGHLVPTAAVVRDFGEISTDNRRIITMEWVTEGVALIFAGLIVATVTAADRTRDGARAAYACTAAELVVLAGVSLMTGFRVHFLPFRLCPAIFSSAALCITLFGALQLAA